MHISPAWNELLDEFRALGGTADNIRLGHGEFGRGLFPIDAAKPVAVRVPDNLLVAVDDMILADGAVRVGPNAKTGEREKAWLNRYQEEFAWGSDGGDHVRRMFEMAAALPAGLRHTLSTEFRCGLWFAEPTDALVASQFFQARHIGYRERWTVMPLIEMANHGSGPSYDKSDGVALRGTFPGEVLVEYAQLDSYDYFFSWGFATQRPMAFSVALTGAIDSTPLWIGQKFMGGGLKNSVQSWIPKLEKSTDKVTLPFLLLGHQGFPRLPKGIFYRLMRDAGYSGFVESFDLVQHVNRMHFIKLLDTLEGVDLPIAATLRSMARNQLRAMSCCFGVREI